MNKTQRQEAIKALQSDWIEMYDSNAMGQLIRKGSFSDLHADVESLAEMGRSKAWKKGVEQWLDVVAQMYKIFMEQSFDDVDNGDMNFGWELNDEDFGGETRREFQRLIKHAIFQGSTYAFLEA